MTNALRYAGDAEISVTMEDGDALLKVRDHGAGVTSEKLEHLFEPFYRGESSRNRETGGIGLGLASVRSVIRSHGGEARIYNHPESD